MSYRLRRAKGFKSWAMGGTWTQSLARGAYSYLFLALGYLNTRRLTLAPASTLWEDLARTVPNHRVHRLLAVTDHMKTAKSSFTGN
jgi:hypothetical protein